MAKGDKKAASRAAEVMTIETTINLSKRLHGMYVSVPLSRLLFVAHACQVVRRGLRGARGSLCL